MLPIFHVWNESNEEIRKSSDVDTMKNYFGQRVEFNTEIGSNILATIDEEDCEPGYLRLRNAAVNREILRFPAGNIKKIENGINVWDCVSSNERYHKKTFTHGPATGMILFGREADLDEVIYFSCSSWPPIAQTWIDRERLNNWPSKEIIEEIVSKGCRIVHKPHPSSKDPDAEFRFSFSVAELILFHSLSVDQKKCFIAFKALVKYRIHRSECIAKKEVGLCSYHLKTIFLWTCETIPADQWQTTIGWARCLLHMIDQLYACLKSRTLPGYFIEECNLMDSIDLPQSLFSEIEKLRRDPISSAATFLDSTRCFRRSYFEISDHIQELCGFDLIEEITLKRQLNFLQKMMIEMDLTRGVTKWKKEAVLRIFAIWCHQYSHEIHLASWQCLTTEMTLFDVVHLDNLHGFDVPINVLLEYVDREWSAEVVCKLAICYSMKAVKRENRMNEVVYSLHLKTFLMIRQAINYKHPTLDSIITSVSILMRCKEYEMSVRVLESAFHECIAEMQHYINCKELYTDLISHKMKNEIHELYSIQNCGYNRTFGMIQSIPTLICFSLSICYRYCGDENNRTALFEEMRVSIESVNSNDEGYDKYNWHYSYFLLMLEVFENSEKWKSLYFKIYKKFMSNKIKTIEHELEERKQFYEKTPSSEQRYDMNIPGWAINSLCSCNEYMMEDLNILAHILLIYDECPAEFLNNNPISSSRYFERTLTYYISTNADRVYFSQVLIFNRKLEQAISILKDVVEQEGDYSTSVVIWPKGLYESRFFDDNLRKELIKSSIDYIVFPTNLYARYLLTVSFSLLGEEENRSKNLGELIVLQERYSTFQEFAPMLDIMSTVISQMNCRNSTI